MMYTDREFQSMCHGVYDHSWTYWTSSHERLRRRPSECPTSSATKQQEQYHMPTNNHTISDHSILCTVTDWHDTFVLLSLQVVPSVQSKKHNRKDAVSDAAKDVKNDVQDNAENAQKTAKNVGDKVNKPLGLYFLQEHACLTCKSAS